MRQVTEKGLVSCKIFKGFVKITHFKIRCFQCTTAVIILILTP